MDIKFETITIANGNEKRLDKQLQIVIKKQKFQLM